MRSAAGIGVAAFAVTAGWLANVRADEPAAPGEPGRGDPALAEALFREGRDLADQGDYAAACPKLADSQRLDPGGGTVLALAQCYENSGQIASAWAAYGDALAFAQRNGRKDRATRARERMAALELRVSYVLLRVEQPAPGEQVLRDGSPVPASAWGTRIPSDRGEHRVEASAPGRQPWSASVTIDAESQLREITIPVLEPEPPAAVAPAAPDTTPTPPPAPAERVIVRTVQVPVITSPPTSRLIVGYTALGLAAVGVGLGSYFGVRAFDRARDADDRCPVVDCDDAHAVELSEDATRSATISTVAFGSSIVLGGAAAWLLLTPPRRAAPTAPLALSPAGAAGPGPHLSGWF